MDLKNSEYVNSEDVVKEALAKHKVILEKSLSDHIMIDPLQLAEGYWFDVGKNDDFLGRNDRVLLFPEAPTAIKAAVFLNDRVRYRNSVFCNLDQSLHDLSNILDKTEPSGKYYCYNPHWKEDPELVTERDEAFQSVTAWSNYLGLDFGKLTDPVRLRSIIDKNWQNSLAADRNFAKANDFPPGFPEYPDQQRFTAADDIFENPPLEVGEITGIPIEILIRAVAEKQCQSLESALTIFQHEGYAVRNVSSGDKPVTIGEFDTVIMSTIDGLLVFGMPVPLSELNKINRLDMWTGRATDRPLFNFYDLDEDKAELFLKAHSIRRFGTLFTNNLTESIHNINPKSKAELKKYWQQTFDIERPNNEWGVQLPEVIKPLSPTRLVYTQPVNSCGPEITRNGEAFFDSKPYVFPTLVCTLRYPLGREFFG